MGAHPTRALAVPYLGVLASLQFLDPSVAKSLRLSDGDTNRTAVAASGLGPGQRPSADHAEILHPRASSWDPSTAPLP
jgi:hypothetical protein